MHGETGSTPRMTASEQMLLKTLKMRLQVAGASRQQAQPDFDVIARDILQRMPGKGWQDMLSKYSLIDLPAALAQADIREIKRQDHILQPLYACCMSCTVFSLADGW